MITRLIHTRQQLLKFSIHQLSGQLNFTDGCLKTIEQKQNKFKGQFLRLAVEGGGQLQIQRLEGCHGYKYNFSFDAQLQEDDFELRGATNNTLFAVDSETLKLIEGSTIDYEEKMIRAAFFVQENPNAEKSCSCKVSFQPKGWTL